MSDCKIGRCESVLFTELNEGVLIAKIDTGAFNSAMHVDSVKITDSGLVVVIKNSTYIFRKWSELEVKSSNGNVQKRYGVKLKMRLGSKNYKILFSLTNRKDMKYPILLGRKFLYLNDFIVDVKKKNIHGRPKKI